MEHYFISFGYSLWHLLNDLSIYIILGLLIAGILKQIIPEDFVKKQLGKEAIVTILKSALLGIPLPLCSCSVLPFASALRKDGASKSATQTFLISTPITGADSILATWGVFGSIFTLYRLISSIIISLIAGCLTLIFDGDKSQSSVTKEHSEHKEHCCSTTSKSVTPMAVNTNNSCSTHSTQSKNDHCCSSSKVKKRESFIIRVYNYAFNTLLEDIAQPLIVGLVIAAFITTFLPNSLPKFLTDSMLLSYFVMLFISLPMYVCATASLPLGVSFLLMGFSPGAVLIFLTAGPASNAVTIMIVKRILGAKSLIIYLASIVIGSLVFAYFMDLFFARSIEHIVSDHFGEEQFNILDIASSILLLGLSFKLIAQKFFGKKADSCCH